MSRTHRRTFDATFAMRHPRKLTVCQRAWRLCIFLPAFFHQGKLDPKDRFPRHDDDHARRQEQRGAKRQSDPKAVIVSM
jgi:hypothetical protein